MPYGPSSAADRPAEPDRQAATFASPAPLRTSLVRWSTEKRWLAGERNGVVVRGGSIRIGTPAGVRTWKDPHGSGPARRYAYGRWVSRWVDPSFGFRDVVPSWSAKTPKGTWLQPEIRVRARSGTVGSWDVLGHWQGRLTGIHDSSQGSQDDDVASVLVDTLRTNAPARRWQIRFTLYRAKGTDRSPRVASVGGVASTLAPDDPPTSRPGPGRGDGTKVPAYSQMIHRGHYPQWGNGGEAWCSPTSMAMVLAAWGRGPTRKQHGWVPDGHPNPQVDHAARMIYDHRYEGTGNWPFTAAYAGTRGLDAFVTRLPSLRAAERYLDAGIPLVLSIAFGSGELDGAPISSSDGHLLVLRGFTRSGQPVVNDPAAGQNAGVRRVYQRGQLERAWLTASAGTTYVARPARVDLPPR